MKKITGEMIAKLVLGAIEAWNKKSIGGRRTRGMSPKQWEAHCKQVCREERRVSGAA